MSKNVIYMSYVIINTPKRCFNLQYWKQCRIFTRHNKMGLKICHFMVTPCIYRVLETKNCLKSVYSFKKNKKKQYSDKNAFFLSKIKHEN